MIVAHSLFNGLECENLGVTYHIDLINMHWAPNEILPLLLSGRWRMGPAKLQTEPENTNHIRNSSMVYDLFKKFSLTIYIISSPTLPSVWYKLTKQHQNLFISSYFSCHSLFGWGTPTWIPNEAERCCLLVMELLLCFNNLGGLSTITNHTLEIS